MSSTGKAWIVAASVGAVEALKDHGFCRWNYTIRSLHQNALRSFSSSFTAQTQLPNSNSQSSSAITSMASSEVRNDDYKANRSEESLRKVMYLSCWGPN